MMGTQQKFNTTELFEDLYRANARESLYELHLILTRVEAFPKPTTRDNKAKYEALRYLIGEALVAREKRLCELRTRYEALPREKKEEEV